MTGHVGADRLFRVVPKNEIAHAIACSGFARASA
jgi:hypothetical protein